MSTILEVLKLDVVIKSFKEKKIASLECVWLEGKNGEREGDFYRWTPNINYSKFIHRVYL